MKLQLGWLALLAVTLLRGQTPTPYLPADSVTLHQEITLRTNSALRNAPPEYAQFFVDAYRSRDTFLHQSIRDSAYLFDTELRPLLEEIFARIAHTNGLNLSPLVLLDHTWENNARSIGEGIFVVNLGLLANQPTLEQLTFVLCHEVAHDQLGHQLLGLAEAAQRRETMSATVRKLSRPVVFRGDRRQRSLTGAYRNSIYGMYRQKREAELQADSLALVYFARLGYPLEAAQHSLGNLEPTPPADTLPAGTLTDLLQTSAYPLRESWWKPAPQLFGGGTFGAAAGTEEGERRFWQPDSLNTHPALAARQETMHLRAAAQTNAHNTPEHDHGKSAAVTAELLRAYHFDGAHGLALITNLRALIARPDDRNLRANVGQNLADIYRAIETHDFDDAVPPPEFFTDAAAQRISRMLRQMRREELRELFQAYTTVYPLVNN